MRPMQIAGARFGRLIVIRQIPDHRKNSYWLCVCDCGAEKVLTGNNLRRGLIKSCGCLNRENTSTRFMRHGHTSGLNRALNSGRNTSEYQIWAAMKRRCFNPNCPEYRWYGARGITVCDRWLQFENFFADMGPRPKGLTLDRIDNDGNYEPSNCRWRTRIEQANNTRQNRIVSLLGKTMTMTQACNASGLPPSTVSTRIKRGWHESRWFVPKIR